MKLSPFILVLAYNFHLPSWNHNPQFVNTYNRVFTNFQIEKL
ncbi:MAG TPA: hypothetical protein PLY48_04315 [Candidatus Cloacimonas acidaminovorans]|jgi:hypothetical protein|nr:hypothetical protein [Candidatus Cloacimonas acidaminovorans]HRS60772.1 hypothetical protein [Candidatus Cloacimonas sp.]HPI42406.1 hypothetical protein [Candidatus Cloacimonas acidaminovorans]HPX58138.1 hypothetical protein [Candidatus Cloacimonas acidaminovorans]HQC08588.1 hypothetical protein [Candidatus Cloacimonas acidaminovorans]